MSELLPCPFCGEPEPNAESYTNEYWVRCPKCDATCATCYSELCARDKWNTRFPAPVAPGGVITEEGVSCRQCLDTGMSSLGEDEGMDYCEACAIGREKSLAEEVNEYVALTDRLSSLLTRTANALKGDPDPLTLHDWSDLPKVAADLRAALSAALSPDAKVGKQ